MSSCGLKQTQGLTLQALEHSHDCWGDNIAHVTAVSAFCWHQFSSSYSNNLPFLSPQLTFSFYWCNCCFLSYSCFKGHWRVNLEIKSLLAYYLVTRISENHLNKTSHFFALLKEDSKAKLSQLVYQQPPGWI